MSLTRNKYGHLQKVILYFGQCPVDDKYIYDYNDGTSLSPLSSEPDLYIKTPKLLEWFIIGKCAWPMSEAISEEGFWKPLPMDELKKIIYEDIPGLDLDEFDWEDEDDQDAEVVPPVARRKIRRGNKRLYQG